MKESEFPSLELCRQIGHLFPGHKGLWWEVDSRDNSQNIVGNLDVTNVFGYYPAPTVCEMLERLQSVRYESHGFPCLQIIYDMGITQSWHVHYRNPPLDWVKNGSQNIQDKHLPSALAKLLIHLDKEGLL